MERLIVIKAEQLAAAWAVLAKDTSLSDPSRAELIAKVKNLETGLAHARVTASVSSNLPDHLNILITV
jgi:hypothetical protein